MHKIIRAYSKLVIAYAMKYKNYGLSITDLVQEGHIGLMQAIAKFEPQRDIRFSTYAGWWIRSSIQDYVLKKLVYSENRNNGFSKIVVFQFEKIKIGIDALRERSK